MSKKNKLKFLISPGFAKCGTTFLFDQIIKEKGLFNYSENKELGAFRVQWSREQYINMFRTRGERKVFLDFSPPYCMPGSDSLKNISSALKSDNVRILFCLRSPIERAYSHYTHEMIGCGNLFGFDSYRFEDPRILSRYLPRQLDFVEEAIALFGADRVHGYSIDDKNAQLDDTLCKFLRLPEGWKPDSRGERHAGRWLPRIYFNASEPELIVQDGKVYELPPRWLLISAGKHSVIHTNWPVSVAERLASHAATWTRSFNPAQLGPAAQEAYDDYRAARLRLGMGEPTPMKAQLLVASDPPPIPVALLEQLRLVGVLADSLDATFSFGKPDRSAKLSRPTMAVIQLKAEALINSLYVTTSAEHDIAIRREILDTLEEAMDSFGPVPGFINDFVVNGLICRQAERVTAFLNRHYDWLPMLKKTELNNSIDYFRSSMSAEMYTELKRLMQSFVAAASIEG